MLQRRDAEKSDSSHRMGYDRESFQLEEDTLDFIRQAFPKEDADIVLKACDYVAGRLGRRPDVGLRAARILLSQQTDHIVVASALLASLYLHNIPLDLEDLENIFGKPIADLVEGLERTEVMRTDSEAHRQADMKAFLGTLEGDLRSTIVRIGLRFAELERIAKEGSGNCSQIAQETLDVHVPIARRMGMGALRERLEDLSFRLLEPDIYEELARQVDPIRTEDQACVEILMAAVRKLLDRNGLKGIVSGRVKGLYSIYVKMRRLNAPLEAIMDKIGIRIIVSSVTDCYHVLGLLHTHFRPIPGTFDDYIGLPKDNGYQSLHTCIYPLRDISHKPVEFQVRTELMHMEAEFGIAAHWRYKSEAEADTEGHRQLLWLRSLQQHCDEASTHAGFVERLRKEAFDDHLVVFTKGGCQVRLAAGSTVRGFLQRVGRGPVERFKVKVNGQMESLDYQLCDGDTIEFMRDEKTSSERTLAKSRPDKVQKGNDALCDGMPG